MKTVKGGITKSWARSSLAHGDLATVSQKASASAIVLFIFQLVPIQGRLVMRVAFPP